MKRKKQEKEEGLGVLIIIGIIFFIFGITLGVLLTLTYIELQDEEELSNESRCGIYTNFADYPARTNIIEKYTIESQTNCQELKNAFDINYDPSIKYNQEYREYHDINPDCTISIRNYTYYNYFKFDYLKKWYLNNCI